MPLASRAASSGGGGVGCGRSGVAHDRDDAGEGDARATTESAFDGCKSPDPCRPRLVPGC